VTGVAMVLMGAALAVLWRGLLWRGRDLPDVTRSEPLLVGHRGVRGSLPENSLAAFGAALEAGLDGLETDVQRSRDGVLVLLHDPHVNGLAVASLTIAELRERVPELATLDELYALVRRFPGTWLNLEIKSVRPFEPRLVRSLVRSVRSSGLAGRITVSSFNPVALALLRLSAPELRTGYLWPDSELPSWLRSGWPAGWLHVDALHPNWRQVDARLVARARRRGLAVNTWTVNEPEDVRRMVDLGAGGIMADDPEALIRAARGGTG
jgi:glycerophosphoryl diester phosphodiesterase